MSKDTIYREDAIDAIECVRWYHQNRNKDMVSGANSAEDQAWYKAEDIYDALKAVPSADTDMSGYSDRLWKNAYERGKADGTAWIPCSEREPKGQGYYICTCKDGSKYKRATVVKWSNGWQLTGSRTYWVVVAWMPLPKPWEGSDDEV